jgi:hypothetical protein
MSLEIKVDSWLTVVSSLLSIAAIVGGACNFLAERRQKKLDKWVERFRVYDSHGMRVKIENMQNCFKELKSESAVKEVFLKALITPSFSEENCNKHFEMVWSQAFPK